MSTPPLSAGEIRAAAEVHRELGPEYSDAVVDSFLAKIDREVEARIDARLARTGTRPLPDRAKQVRRRSLLIGSAIGAGVTGLPLTLVGWHYAAVAWVRGWARGAYTTAALEIWVVILIAYVGFCVAALARKPRDRD